METVFVFVLLIVLISCASGVINNYLKHRREFPDVEAGDEVLEEIEELRARIVVLEKIVTDEKYQLKQELDQLERRA